MQDTTEIPSATETVAAPAYIGQAALLLERAAREETPARFNRMVEVAASLKRVAAHLERFLNAEAEL